MKAEDAMECVVELVNEDRPFTREEREKILSQVAEVTRLLRINERFMKSAFWMMGVAGFLLGCIFKGVFP